eukprot:9022335-Pyramimonas_sp.AAC.1
MLGDGGELAGGLAHILENATDWDWEKEGNAVEMSGDSMTIVNWARGVRVCSTEGYAERIQNMHNEMNKLRGDRGVRCA